MARPKKSDHEQRKSRTVRYTDAEWDDICKKAAQSGMSPSQFTRETSLGARVTLAYGPKKTDPEKVMAVNRLSLQFSNYGNLINQMAPIAHSTGEIPTEFVEHWMQMKADIEALQSQASNTLTALVQSDEREDRHQ